MVDLILEEVPAKPVSKIDVVPSKRVILFLLVPKVPLIFHLRSLFLKIAKFTSISKPLFSIWARLP
jgi:hypothetical protein